VPGAIGVDRVTIPGVDIVCDLRHIPFPFKDGTVSTIHCRHVLEHLDPEKIPDALREMHRILRSDGILHVSVPHFFGIGYAQDPTHRGHFTIRTMDYFQRQHPCSYYFDFHFSMLDTKLNVNNFYDWTNLTRGQRRVNTFLTRLLNRMLRRSSSLADLAIKVLPLYYVEIAWTLKKVM